MAGSRWAVYPRECGEAHNTLPPDHWDYGLSPRVRGSLALVRLAEVRVRSIPASAGKPHNVHWVAPVSSVYPRECGEACPGVSRPPFSIGLSPRVRGSLRVLQDVIEWRGSIPASAGKPARPREQRRVSEVYPRECGEAWQRHPDEVFERGLSPRVRGSPSSLSSAQRCMGSIPASAGKPPPNQHRRFRTRVYPRECGEAIGIAMDPPVAIGLSPRVRGSPSLGSVLTAEGRSIPASAGKPCWGLSPSRWGWVYPRECGEASR